MPTKKNTKQKNTPFRFEGFSMPHYTQVPDELFDTIMPHLAGAELKVLLYIVRRTFGFKKHHDAISLSQMVNGITTKDGKELDQGTGLGKASVARALSKLEEMRIIMRVRSQSRDRGFEPTSYSLKMREPLSQNETSPSLKMGQAMSHQRDTQHTVEQQKENQQTATADALLSFGIDKPTVDRLIKAHDPAYVRQKIDYVTFLQSEQSAKVKNPRGWLLKAIEDDYDPPAGYRTQLERQQELAKKTIRAEKTKQQQAGLKRLLEDAAEKRKEEEEKGLRALQERYGTTEADVELWQSILNELRDSVGGLTYAFAKSVNLLAIEDDIAFFAAKNKFSIDKINDNNIGEILMEMFHNRGYDLQDMKPVILKEGVL